jgi:hypothetical protein
VVGWLVDARSADGGSPAWTRVAAGLLIGIAVARGAWVALIEHRDRAVVALTLPDDDWTRAIRWAAAQPVGTHLLVDPGHALKYGAPLRYSGQDVYLEEVKDVALAFYSRDVARRIIERQAALGDFAALDADAARSLATRFGLDVLVIDRDLDLPLLHREGRFRFYALR